MAETGPTSPSEQGSKPTFTPKEAAEKLGISINAIYWHLKAGHIPHIALGTRKLILQEVVASLLRTGMPPMRRGAPTPPAVDPLS
jgi:excisionase family DNA binding protein